MTCVLNSLGSPQTPLHDSSRPVNHINSPWLGQWSYSLIFLARHPWACPTAKFLPAWDSAGVPVNRVFQVVSVENKLTTTFTVVHAFVQIHNGTDSQWKGCSPVSWLCLRPGSDLRF